MSDETTATPRSAAVAAASSSSCAPPPSASTHQLLSWLSPFGLTPESTGLVVWEGCGPEERGLRTTRKIHSTNKQRPADNVESKPVPSEAQCTCTSNASSAAALSASIAAADSAAPPAPYGQSSCSSCFSSAPIVAPLISIPQALLITPDRVRASAAIQSLLGRHAARASDSQLLSLFLVSHHRQSRASKWAPYLASLPVAYTSVEWWSAEELERTQNPSLVAEAASRRAELRREWRRCCEWIREASPATAHREEAKEPEEEEDAPLPLHWTSSLPEHVCTATGPKCSASSLCSLPSLAEFEWGWSTVATRSCFLPAVGSSSSEVAQPPSTSSSKPTVTAAAASNRSCLIPFLDMFNHSSAVHVEARLSSSAYELFMVRPNPLRLSVGSEVFISYGALSNQKLLERYGFALGHNQHESMELTLSEVRAFLARPPPLWSAETLAQLKEPWRIGSGGGIEAGQFMRCGCERHLDLSASLASHLPQWSRALPGFGKMESWQIDVLKACGLYEIAEQMTASHAPIPAVATRRVAPARPSTVAVAAAASVRLAASSDASPSSHRLSPLSSVSFRVDSCSIPFDLLTLVRVAVLSLDEAKAAASTSDSRKQQPPSASSARALDVPKLASLLLNEDRPHLSAGHRLLSHRVLIELLGSRLIDPRGLGRSSLQADVRAWEHRSSLTYVGSQALLLRLTQKRMLHSVLAHLCGGAE